MSLEVVVFGYPAVSQGKKSVNTAYEMGGGKGSRTDFVPTTPSQSYSYIEAMFYIAWRAGASICNGQ